MLSFEHLRGLTQDLSLLYVEDMEEIQKGMMPLFEALFRRVVTASDGRRALELYEQEEAGFDLVITDVMMPVMNGVELCNHIKALKPTQHIIIISASNEGQLVDEGLRAQVDGFILKPVISSQFGEALTRAARAIQESRLAEG